MMTWILQLLLFVTVEADDDCALRCDDGKCLQLKSLCNGHIECEQGQDEANCLDFVCPQGYEKCQDNLQCIRVASMCDGYQSHCNDGSDEDEAFCRAYSCQNPFLKCKNGIQCVASHNFCDKLKRGAMQYHCNDKSDESVWGCQQVGVNCTRENRLWDCGQGRGEDDLCVMETKVCDGRRGLRQNNCANGEDEEESLCRHWKCPDNYVKCGDGLQCVHVVNLCNGRPNCPDESDEGVLEIFPGFVNNCSLPGSPCVTIASEFWLDLNQRGARCSPRRCLEGSKFCNGICDCLDENCIDEAEDLCQDWQCSPGLFKCRSTKLCINSNQVCNGQFDCGSDDASDEANCPCHSSTVNSDSVYFRPLLVSLMTLGCRPQTNAELDVTCMKTVRINATIDPQLKLIRIGMDSGCGFAPCNQSRIQLQPGVNPLVNMDGERDERQLGALSFGTYNAKISLPLVERNFTLIINHQRVSQSDFSCLGDLWMSNELSNRIMASVLFSKDSHVLNEMCQCKGQVGRVDYFNQYHLPSPYYQDLKSYVHSKVSQKLGSFELLYINDPKLCPFRVDTTEIIKMNDFFPTVWYGANQIQDDQNLPIEVMAYSQPRQCQKHLTSSALELMTLLKLANSGVMKTSEGSAWLSISNETFTFYENVICEAKTRVFNYVYSDKNITFLVLNVIGLTKSDEFQVANQRLNLFPLHHLQDLNLTKLIRIETRGLKDFNLLTIGDQQLFEELVLKNETDMTEFSFLRLFQPRARRNYIQIGGQSSLDSALATARIESNLAFFKICPSTRLGHYDQCLMNIITDRKQIQKALASRWSRTCFGLSLNYNDVYVILPSQVDTFFIMFNSNTTRLVQSPLEVKQPLKLTVKPLVTSDKTVEVTSKLIQLSGQLHCPNSLIQDHPSFYVSTLVSALINDNAKCVDEICSSSKNLFFTTGNINYLGPFDAVWQSSCFQEFGFDLVEKIFEAKRSGLLTVNKFWAFESFNYLIYSNEVHQWEAIYLSTLAVLIEAFFATVMTVVSAITVFGNLLVFGAIAIDPLTKKSVYQYLQMSLCLADVLMGVAGAGSIVVIQVGLLTGVVDIYDFIHGDAFTATFSNPQEVSRSGLNQFYFLTERPALVLCGALVSLSSTVSLLVLFGMSFTRYQVASSSSSASTKIFRAAKRHKIMTAICPWLIGLCFTGLHFVDVANGQVVFQAFFDPVSKLTILLPASTQPINFYLQAGLGAVVSILTIYYTIQTWQAINENAKSIKERQMISQQHQLQKRLAEERKWLHLTIAIILAYIISILPVFIFFTASIFGVKSSPVVQLLVWWLLVSGSFLNLIIYTGLNEQMKRSIQHTWNLVLFKIGVKKTQPFQPVQSISRSAHPTSATQIRTSKL